VETEVNVRASQGGGWYARVGEPDLERGFLLHVQKTVRTRKEGKGKIRNECFPRATGDTLKDCTPTGKRAKLGTANGEVKKKGPERGSRNTSAGKGEIPPPRKKKGFPWHRSKKKQQGGNPAEGGRTYLCTLKKGCRDGEDEISITG